MGFGANLHGSFAMAMRKNLPRLVDPAAIERGLGSLGEEQRLQFLSVTASGWVPLETMDAVLAAVAAAAGTTVDQLHRDLSRMSMQDATRGVWRIVLRVLNDATLLDRAAFMFAKTYDRGRATARKLDERCAEVVIEDWPAIPDYPVRGMTVGVRTLIELSGRKGVRATVLRTPDGARFRFVWE